MYLDYFGLSRLPFSIAPDPELLYLSPSHHEALAHLNYALTGHGGLICLTGEVGMGKTTLCRAFIDQVPDYVDIAYIFNPMLSAPELLQSICTELEISDEGGLSSDSLTNKQLIDRLYQALLERYASGRKVICIIDEAQSMPAPLLEQIRLLTNLETNREKLLTLILVGQPELQEILAQYSNRQLDQRITARFHLPAMNKKQLKPYLQHRLVKADGDENVFTDGAISTIWSGSNGIPRVINSIADRALLGAYATSSPRVTKSIAKQATQEVVGQPKRKAAKSLTDIGSYSFVLISLIAIVFFLLLNQSQDSPLWNMKFWGENSYQRLAELNGLDIEVTDFSNCKAIEKNSEFACLALDWSLADLKKLQQSMAVYDGEQWQVVVSSQLSIRPLRSMILWKPVKNYKNPVKPGESHELIAWVRAVLADEVSLGDWQVIAPSGASNHNFHSYYDPILAQKVQSFQRKSGLKADRIIGLKTLLALQVRDLKPAFLNEGV
jgi:general secretion pathway protein A